MYPRTMFSWSLSSLSSLTNILLNFLHYHIFVYDPYTRSPKHFSCILPFFNVPPYYLLVIRILLYPYFPPKSLSIARLAFLVFFPVSDTHAPTTSDRMDAAVRTTWPDPHTQPELHSIVSNFMSHQIVLFMPLFFVHKYLPPYRLPLHIDATSYLTDVFTLISVLFRTSSPTFTR